jgi:hypothetical protein
MWLAAGIVLILCGPWYGPKWHLVLYAAEPLPTRSTFLTASLGNIAALVTMAGLPVFLVAAAGAFFLATRREIISGKRGIWISAGSLVLSYWIFHSVTCPDPPPRYMLAALPAMILFMPVGTMGIARILQCRPVYAALAVGAAFVACSFRIVPKQHFGYSEVAEAIARRPDFASAVVLTDGSSASEGMIVSEIALKDRRPAHYVLRGSKLLAIDTWMGANYRPLYRDTSEVLGALDGAGVTVVILEAKPTNSQPHHELLARALTSAPTIWQRWDENAWGRNEYFVVYKRVRPIRGPFRVEIPMDNTLRRSLVFWIPATD